MNVQPYLFFDGRCQEALDFYTKAVGAQITMKMLFKEAPIPAEHRPPGSDNKVMHCTFKIGDTTLMGSDGDCKGQMKSDGFALSITVDNDADADRKFKALGEGGMVTMPMNETFFAKKFGMVKDKFGIHWMVIFPKPM